MSSAAHYLICEIQDINNTLKELSSLAPSPIVNTLLGRLVELCIQPFSEDLARDLLSMPEVEELCLSLRPMCATAEGELERCWARRMLESSNSLIDSNSDTLSTSSLDLQPHELLASFPYHQNYIDLSRLECCTLEAFLPSTSLSRRPSPKNVAFIGSGPLPLTSFCLLDIYPEAHVHNIDRDQSALELSQQLAEKLGYCSRMSFSCEDVSLDPAAKPTEWSQFDVVFLAALVGMDTTSKVPILAHLARKLKPGTLVVARSAQGLREVLYPVLELGENLQRVGYEILGEVHPWTKVVNSIVVLRVEG